ISKLTRVLVDASKNRLTIILPRSVSRRRKVWSPSLPCGDGWKKWARSRMASISARSMLSISSRPALLAAVFGILFLCRAARGALHDEHFLHVVDFLELHFDNLVAG